MFQYCIYLHISVMQSCSKMWSISNFVKVRHNNQWTSADRLLLWVQKVSTLNLYKLHTYVRVHRIRLYCELLQIRSEFIKTNINNTSKPDSSKVICKTVNKKVGHHCKTGSCGFNCMLCKRGMNRTRTIKSLWFLSFGILNKLSFC